MRKENTKTTLRKSILSRYTELLVQNGYYIGHLFGTPLCDFNYEILVEKMLDETLDTKLHDYERKEYRQKLEELNLITFPGRTLDPK